VLAAWRLYNAGMRCAAVFFVLASLLVCVPGAQADDAKQSPPRDATEEQLQKALASARSARVADPSIKTVVAELAAEARLSLYTDQQFPRSRPTYASDEEIDLPPTEAAEALAQKLDRSDVIDSYIKWQLLSFDPPLHQLKAAQLGQAVANAPGVLPMPRAKQRRVPANGGVAGPWINVGRQVAVNRGGRGAFDPDLSVVNSGTVLAINGGVSADGRSVGMTIEASNARIIEIRKVRVGLAAPAIAVRDAVVAAMPQDNGMRFAAMVEDVRGRALAAHPSTSAAVRRLVAESEALRASESLPRPTRKALSDVTRDLLGVHGEALERVSLDRTGQFYELEHERVAVDTDAVKAAMVNLRHATR